jgi:hypothetical protein
VLRVDGRLGPGGLMGANGRRRVVIMGLAGVDFDGGIFTTLDHDHLDYHGTIEAYAKVKRRFLGNLSASAFALANADDSYGRSMLATTAAQVAFYGRGQLARRRRRTRPPGSPMPARRSWSHAPSRGRAGARNRRLRPTPPKASAACSPACAAYVPVAG